jgi:hypothetical protein
MRSALGQKRTCQLYSITWSAGASTDGGIHFAFDCNSFTSAQVAATSLSRGFAVQ